MSLMSFSGTCSIRTSARRVGTHGIAGWKTMDMAMAEYGWPPGPSDQPSVMIVGDCHDRRYNDTEFNSVHVDSSTSPLRCRDGA